ncbi:MAG: ATP-binding cassette domain-containing protein [Bacteroidetes bacterium]|nr:ATP-binding cassette domain-containing protein [Bacteroidota bacterium]MCW5896576.1 ATP-binding cassette domain-containing protein [Bacteroidota bacterium]
MTISRTIRIAAGKRRLVSIDNFEIPENRITLLLGESGIGKSLISKALYGLLDPDELDITIDGEPYRKYLSRPETAQLQHQSFFVFQEPSTHLNPLMTLATQMREGSLGFSNREDTILGALWQHSPPDDIKKIVEVYPEPHRPSGGEKQRILLAMAFKKIDLLIERKQPSEYEIFVFDEPTGSLDNVYRDVFLDMLLERFRKVNFTCLLITHDYSMIEKINVSHKDVMNKLAFKEVTLKGDTLALENFDTDAYLEWLHTQHPSGESRTESARTTLLTIESGARVFDRTLRISSDKERKNECSLQLHAGDIVYLKAASGVGKTTLVKLAMGLLQAGHLAARLGGLEMNEKTPRSFWHKNIWGRKMTMVFQHADEALNPESTVKGTFEGLPALKRPTDAQVITILRELFDSALDASFLTKKVKHLSGGQKQRLNLLRGFALDTDILILDEPLNGLDFESAGKVIAMLQRKQNAGKGILLISHNEEIFDRIVKKENVYYLRAETDLRLTDTA